MTPFEQGYNRTMKIAGILDRLRRVPRALRELPETYRDLRRAQGNASRYFDMSEQALQRWKKDPNFALDPEDADRYRRALAQATTENLADDPRRLPLEFLQEHDAAQYRANALRELRNEQLKDVGVGGAAVAAPLAGAGLVMSQED